MIRLAVAGAGGRMGRIILNLASRDSGFKIVGGIESSGHPEVGRDVGKLIGADFMNAPISDDPLRILREADVLIDFTHASTTGAMLSASVRTKTAYVIGTTGLKEKELRLIRHAAKRIPIVQSPNMSIGVNLLFKLAEVTSRALDETYDVELAEIHHRMKKDAPSGTALKLVEILARNRKRNPQKDVVFGRKGDIGARAKGEIGVFALRGGDVVGDHILSFLGDGERMELIHRATSRESFARGALRAARFVAARKKGLFDMRQVLGLDS